MSNVVPLRGSGEEQEPTGLEPKEAWRLIPVLHDLLASQAICDSAFHLGVQVVQRFRETGYFRTVIVPSEAMYKFVQGKDGRILSRLPFKVEQDYLSALQDLHIYVGMENHFLASGLESREYGDDGHFTLDPMLTAGVHYSMSTPIHIAFDPNSYKELCDYAEECKNVLRERFTATILTWD